MLVGRMSYILKTKMTDSVSILTYHISHTHKNPLCIICMSQIPEHHRMPHSMLTQKPPMISTKKGRSGKNKDPCQTATSCGVFRFLGILLLTRASRQQVVEKTLSPSRILKEVPQTHVCHCWIPACRTAVRDSGMLFPVPLSSRGSVVEREGKD